MMSASILIYLLCTHTCVAQTTDHDYVCCSAATASITLALFEEWPENYVHDAEQSIKLKPQVRVVFLWYKGVWRSLKNADNSQVEPTKLWYGYRGSAYLGNIRSQPIEKTHYIYEHEYSCEPIETNDLQYIPNSRSIEFGPDKIYRQYAVHRPVVLLDKKLPQHPDPYRMDSIHIKERDQLIDIVTHTMGKHRKVLLWDLVYSTNMEITGDLLTLEEIITTVNGTKLVSFRLDEKLDIQTYQGEIFDGVIWIGIDSNGEVFPIGRNLVFVDAFDYDGNGDIELIFWVSEYNRNGYLLVSESFDVLASTIWSYH